MIASRHMVEIPESFLLTIAVYGNMGEGDLPRTMQVWAEKECDRLGLNQKVITERQGRYEELKRRVSNVWGRDVTERIEQTVAMAAPSISAAIDAARRNQE